MLGHDPSLPRAPLCSALLSKIQEQIERTSHLVRLLPPERAQWTPSIPGGWSAEMLLGHLLDCLAGFCAVLAAAEPERLARFAELRKLPVNHAFSPSEASERIDAYRAHIDEGVALLEDQDLSRRLPTVFVRNGEPILTLLLGNLEHLINHKHQLFTYLKLMGIDVRTRDLYRFREAVE